METIVRIKEIIGKTLNVEVAGVTDDLSIGGIPQWDSMGNIAIISAIEEAFEVEIPMEDLFELNSVKAISDWISSHK